VSKQEAYSSLCIKQGTFGDSNSRPCTRKSRESKISKVVFGLGFLGVLVFGFFFLKCCWGFCS